MQITRNLCDAWDGFLLDKKYLILDNGVTFTIGNDNLLMPLEQRILHMSRFLFQRNSDALI